MNKDMLYKGASPQKMIRARMPGSNKKNVVLAESREKQHGDNFTAGTY
jgi:hypothetical protein